MCDKVTPVENDLSVLDETAKGVKVQPVQTDKTVKADLQSEGGSATTLRPPSCLQLRPIAAFSKVDIDKLPELTPSPTPSSSTPLLHIVGGKDLELVLQVLLTEKGPAHVLRTLVDTGAKVPLIVKTGVLQSSTAAAHPLNLVTADGTPMMGGTTGATATLKIPIAVPKGRRLTTSAMVVQDHWVYEADISGVDMIIGNPFLCAMKLVPVP